MIIAFKWKKTAHFGRYCVALCTLTDAISQRLHASNLSRSTSSARTTNFFANRFAVATTACDRTKQYIGLGAVEHLLLFDIRAKYCLANSPLFARCGGGKQRIAAHTNFVGVLALHRFTRRHPHRSLCSPVSAAQSSVIWAHFAYARAIVCMSVCVCECASVYVHVHFSTQDKLKQKQ